MTAASKPELEPGRVYRTRDLRQWSANPTRLAQRLVREGKLRHAGHGLYHASTLTRFGHAPATDAALLRAFFCDEPFVLTGPPYWNALGLGATSMFAVTLVYNRRRTGEFELGGRRFLLRRVYFPEQPTAEWFIIDLLQHHEMAGSALSELQVGLVATLREGRWDRDRLRQMAETFGTKATQKVVDEALRETEQ